MKVRVDNGFPQPKQFSLRLDDLDEIIKKNKNTKVILLMIPEELNQ